MKDKILVNRSFLLKLRKAIHSHAALALAPENLAELDQYLCAQPPKAEQVPASALPSALSNDDLRTLTEFVSKELMPLYSAEWKGWPGTIAFAKVAVDSLNRYLISKQAPARQKAANAKADQPTFPCKSLCELCVRRGYSLCANVSQTTPIPYPAQAALSALVVSTVRDPLAESDPELYRQMRNAKHPDMVHAAPPSYWSDDWGPGPHEYHSLPALSENDPRNYTLPFDDQRTLKMLSTKVFESKLPDNSLTQVLIELVRSAFHAGLHKDFISLGNCEAHALRIALEQQPGSLAKDTSKQDPNQPYVPKVGAVFETPTVTAHGNRKDGVWVGRTAAPVKRVEAQDDGSFTVFIDYWPKDQEAALQAQRTWVSLSDERLLELFLKFISAMGETWISSWRKTENELKEKNT